MADSADLFRTRSKGFQNGFFVLSACAFFLVILFYPLSLLFIFKVVREYERAVLLRRGYIISSRLRGPGVFFMLPCTDDIRVVDIRTAVLEVQQTEITTNDGIGAQLDVAVCYYIIDPTLNDSLKTVLAKMKQRDLLDQSSVGEEIQSHMAKAAEQFGVAIEQVDVKDVTLSSETQMPEFNEREIINNTLKKLQTSCKENNFTRSQTLQESAAILEEARTLLKLCHDQATRDIQENSKKINLSDNSTDILSNELLSGIEAAKSLKDQADIFFKF